jgi:hypothetical protein
VNRGIEQRDDAALGIDGVWDVDFAPVLVQEPSQPFADQRFAVAGRTIHEDRFAAAHRRAKLIEQCLADNHPVKRLLEGFRAALDGGDLL